MQKSQGYVSFISFYDYVACVNEIIMLLIYLVNLHKYELIFVLKGVFS